MRVKYPRTLHHPASPGVGSDDKIARDLSAFDGADVVVTEKMDGENTTLYSDGFHARSLDTGYHPSRDWLAAFQARIGYLIRPGRRICGEYLYARHSVAYDSLTSYFLGFSAWDETNTCLSWDDTLAEFDRLGITPVPTLYRGPYTSDLVPTLAAKIDTTRSEGVVTRLAAAFPYQNFAKSIIKWVRAGHVQSNTHWRNAPLIPNRMEAPT